MLTITQLAAVITVVGLLTIAYLAIQAAFAAIRRYRGVRLVTCPETTRAAAVDVDSVHVAVTAAWGTPVLRLRDCSRWPERAACGQQCLAQVEDAPHDCLVRTILPRAETFMREHPALVIERPVFRSGPVAQRTSGDRPRRTTTTEQIQA